MKAKKIVLIAGMIVIGALGLAEVACRLSGITDFPIYVVDDQIGYIAAPNQSGHFLDKNEWEINAKSQGTTAWQPAGNRDLLLLGDSVVWGGNPLNQSDKLGPNLERRLHGWKVWPASAGGWSLANEMAYLDRFPEVPSEADAIVWVVNSGDLYRAARWESEWTHPRARPTSSLAYVFEKYIKPKLLKTAPPADGTPAGPKDPEIAPAVELALTAQLKTLRANHSNQRIYFVLYPAKAELPGAGVAAEAFYQKFRSHLLATISGQAELIEIRDDPRWNASFYRDDIHPNAPGDSALAEIIADRLRATNGDF